MEKSFKFEFQSAREVTLFLFLIYLLILGGTPSHPHAGAELLTPATSEAQTSDTIEVLHDPNILFGVATFPENLVSSEFHKDDPWLDILDFVKETHAKVAANANYYTEYLSPIGIAGHFYDPVATRMNPIVNKTIAVLRQSHPEMQNRLIDQSLPIHETSMTLITIENLSAEEFEGFKNDIQFAVSGISIVERGVSKPFNQTGSTALVFGWNAEGKAMLAAFPAHLQPQTLADEAVQLGFVDAITLDSGRSFQVYMKDQSQIPSSSELILDQDNILILPNSVQNLPRRKGTSFLGMR